MVWAKEVMPPPDRDGTVGRAWNCDIVALRQRLNVAAYDDATLAIWCVEAPWAHPLWHSYRVALVHLRPMRGGRETKFYRDGATHEFWVEALNPEKPRLPAIRGEESGKVLVPLNFAAQLVEPSDEAARTRIEAAIDLMIAGELNPDTDARRQWEALFGDAMIKPEWRARG